MSWSRNQVVSAAARIRKTWGGFWPHIGLDVQTALVDAEVLSVLLDQDAVISVEAIEELREALHNEMNVGEFGKTPILLDPNSFT